MVATLSVDLARKACEAARLMVALTVVMAVRPAVAMSARGLRVTNALPANVRVLGALMETPDSVPEAPAPPVRNASSSDMGSPRSGQGAGPPGQSDHTHRITNVPVNEYAERARTVKPTPATAAVHVTAIHMNAYVESLSVCAPDASAIGNTPV
jgi:hypothetical protein